MRRGVTLLAFLGCGVDPATHGALEQRVDLLQRRLEAVETAQARVNTPRAEPEPTAVAAPELVERVRPSPRPVLKIGLGRSGVTIDGAAVPHDEIDAVLRVHAARADITGVILDADDDVEYAVVIAMMDRLRDSGLDRVAIATRGGARPEPAE